MGRTAQGNLATRLRQQEQPVGCVSLSPQQSILIVSQGGYAKRLSVSTIRRGSRGDIGSQCLQFIDSSDRLAGMVPVHSPDKRVKLITNQKRVFSLTLKDVSVWGKDGVGDRAVKLKAEEAIANVILLFD
jgi:DNA gyrase subunit A